MNRLGYTHISEIKNHPWLESVNWKDLYSHKVEPPFRPPFKDNFDPQKSQVEKLDKMQINKYNNLLKEEAYKKIFKNFAYYERENELAQYRITTDKTGRKSTKSQINILTNPHTSYSQSTLDARDDYLTHSSYNKSSKSVLAKNQNKLKKSLEHHRSISTNTLNLVPETNIFKVR